LEQVDSSFSPGSFSEMPLECQKEILTGILLRLLDGKSPTGFIRLFESLYSEPLETAAELSKDIGAIPRNSASACLPSITGPDTESRAERHPLSAGAGGSHFPQR
jgi:hypothetical protein